jgi:hypothetical protein
VVSTEPPSVRQARDLHFGIVEKAST